MKHPTHTAAHLTADCAAQEKAKKLHPAADSAHEVTSAIKPHQAAGTKGH